LFTALRRNSLGDISNVVLSWFLDTVAEYSLVRLSAPTAAEDQANPYKLIRRYNHLSQIFNHVHSGLAGDPNPGAPPRRVLVRIAHVEVLELRQRSVFDSRLTPRCSVYHSKRVGHRTGFACMW
jgi:hypothetical protein